VTHLSQVTTISELPERLVKRLYSWLHKKKKKTGKEHFPNVNQVLSIIMSIVYLKISF
jgi:hypothetical protein